METQPEQANSASIPAAKPAATKPKEANSASSPANKNITSDVPATTPKIKNPGRVASGKRLAERSKEAREAKNNRSKITLLRCLTHRKKKNLTAAIQATTFLGLVA